MKNFNTIPMTSESRVHDFVKALTDVYPNPLMIKELAQIVGTSPNTAGKYVDILAAQNRVTVNQYASAKQVVLKDPPEKERKK